MGTAIPSAGGCSFSKAYAHYIKSFPMNNLATSVLFFIGNSGGMHRLHSNRTQSASSAFRSSFSNAYAHNLKSFPVNMLATAVLNIIYFAKYQ